MHTLRSVILFVLLVSVSVFGLIPGQYTKVGYDRLLSNSYLFNIHPILFYGI